MRRTLASFEPHAGSNADRAYDILRERIIVLDFKPGQPLDDESLGVELGVGRTPIREAFKRLERDRLVLSIPRRGTFTTEIDTADLFAIFDVRRELEPIAASRASTTASRGTRRALLELADNVDSIRSDLPSADLLRLDVRLHRQIYRASGNVHLEDTLVRLDAHATRIWSLLLDRLPDLSQHVRGHAPLLRAIASGDGALASLLTHQHIRSFEETVRELAPWGDCRNLQ